MAALAESLESGAVGPSQMLSVFESIVVDQTKAFLLSVGKEFPDLNKIAEKIRDIPSIRKNISLIVLITYTRIYNKRPQGLELSGSGKVDELANLKILIQSVGASGQLPRDPASLNISAEAILTGSSRADAALHLHALVKLLDQLHREAMDGQRRLEETQDDDLQDENFGDDDDLGGEEGEGGGGGSYDHRGARNDDPRRRGGQLPFPPPPPHGRQPHSDRDEHEGYVEAMMADARKYTGGQRGGGRGGAPGAGGRQRPRHQADPVGDLEDAAAAHFADAAKQREAGKRRRAAVARTAANAREANQARDERRQSARTHAAAADLERWELGRKLRADADQKRAVDGLMAKVLAELGKDLAEDDAAAAAQLGALEQQRISAAASSGALFQDRAAMIAAKAAEAAALRDRALKEQERYVASVLHEAERRHEAALASKLAGLTVAEEAARRAAVESQAALASLFNSTRLEFLAKDRISTGGAPSPFEATMRRIRSNALELRQQRAKQLKERLLTKAYAAPLGAASPRGGQPQPSPRVQRQQQAWQPRHHRNDDDDRDMDRERAASARHAARG